MKILCFPLWLNIRDLYQALIKLFPHQMLQQQLMLVMARANDLSYVVPMMTEGG